MQIDKMLPDFFMNILKEQYKEETVEKIIQGYQNERLVTLRINTLKTDIDTVKEKLKQNNIEFENVQWSKEALIIKNVREEQIRMLEMYENGEIYLQSLSSMLPVIILQPKENTDILDMTAAPGGKTTQIAALTQNKAHITACEMNKIRYERLKYNIEKQGATCVYVMQQDSRKINEYFSFDQILLDAPCSGSGTLSIEDLNSEQVFTQKLIEKSKKTQIELLKKALKLLKPGKEMIYSTCSILSCENEEIVKEALKGVNAKIEPIAVQGIPLLPTKLEGTICVCPTNMYEGFFVAKIRKEM